MRVNFQQGVVQHQANFITLNNEKVDLNANSKSLLLTIAQRDVNYLISIDKDITGAWSGPFSSQDYWLYVDINPVTAAQTFNYTTLEPIVQSNTPTSNQSDSNGVSLLTTGRMWFNPQTKIHYEYTGTAWREVIRVFVAVLQNGASFIGAGIDSPAFTGTQVGLTDAVRAGRILFNDANEPLIRELTNGGRTFYNTESTFVANSSYATSVRLESNVNFTQSSQAGALSAFEIVAYKDDGTIRSATYDDVGVTVVGIITENTLENESVSVILQGVVTNPSWNWTNIGKELWVENGLLVENDPHLSNPSNYPVGRVPVARVLSSNTVIFEQGLGGKGERGPAGKGSGASSPASTTDLGGVMLSVDPFDPDHPIVATDTDPRLSDARVPLSHTHNATEVTYSPAGGVTSNNVQAAITELGNNKLNLSGGTLTGTLTLNSDPSGDLQAVTKQYVDQRVNGLHWIEPVSISNLIADDISEPPSQQALSSWKIPLAYIIPTNTTAVSSWAGLEGHLVMWDVENLNWLDLGTFSSLGYTRLGIGLDATPSMQVFYSPPPPSGTFAGHSGEIATFDNSGTFESFYSPQQGDTVFIEAPDYYQFNRYNYNGSTWVQIGGFKDALDLGDLEDVVLDLFEWPSAPQSAKNQFNDVTFLSYTTGYDAWIPASYSIHLNTLQALSFNNTPNDKAVLHYNAGGGYWVGGDYYLSDIANVDSSILSYDGDVLKYDSYSGYWISGQLNLSDNISNVNASNPADGDVLTFDSYTGNWTAQAPSGGGSGGSLSGLSDVNLGFEGDGSLSDRDMLVYDSYAGAWINVPTLDTIPTPQPLTGYIDGQPSSGQTLLSFLSTERYVLLDYGCAANAGTGPSSSFNADSTYDIQVNGNSVGSFSFDTNGAPAFDFDFSSTPNGLLLINPQDLVKVVGPSSPNSSLADITHSLRCFLSPYANDGFYSNDFQAVSTYSMNFSDVNVNKLVTFSNSTTGKYSTSIQDGYIEVAVIEYSTDGGTTFQTFNEASGIVFNVDPGLPYLSQHSLRSRRDFYYSRGTDILVGVDTVAGISSPFMFRLRVTFIGRGSGNIAMGLSSHTIDVSFPGV